MANTGLRVLGSGAYSDVPADVLAPFDPRLLQSGAVLGAANRAVFCRVVAKKSGFLRDVTVIPSIQSGNIDVGIFDTGDTTATVRTKLGSSGSIACPATLAAPLVPTWDPGAGVIPIAAGRQYDLALAADNNTAAFYRYVSIVSQFGSASWSVPGGALPKLGAFAATSFPLPGSVTEALMTNLQVTFFITARISPT